MSSDLFIAEKCHMNGELTRRTQELQYGQLIKTENRFPLAFILTFIPSDTRLIICDNMEMLKITKNEREEIVGLHTFTFHAIILKRIGMFYR